MISPKAVRVAAKKRENENLRFRTFLKNHADPDELDLQFLDLHKELFSGYDCCQCGNCCRAYGTYLSDEEINSISAYLGMTRQKFLEDCLIRGRDGLELPAPCRFLEMDSKCRIQECKPEGAGNSHIQTGLTACGACIAYSPRQKYALWFLRYWSV